MVSTAYPRILTLGAIAALMALTPTVGRTEQALGAIWSLPAELTHGQLAYVSFVLALGIGILLPFMLWREYRRRELNLRFSLARELVDTVPLGVTMVDKSGIISYANDLVLKDSIGTGIAKSIGMSYEFAVRRALEQGGIWHPDMAQDELLHHLLTDAMVDGYRGEFRLGDGGAFIRQTHHLSTGHVVLIRQDTTEQHARLRQIERLNVELEKQVNLAVATNDELRAFAYAASHDLKSPTNTAMMLVDAIHEDLDGGTAPETEEMFDDLRATLGRMQTMISDVLEYTNTIGEELAMERVSLDEVVAEALADLRADLQGLDAEIEVGALPEVMANRGQMRLLVNNLLSNAAKFRKPGTAPRISVAAATNGLQGLVGFYVQDDGIGIDPKYHDRIFQLFKRLNPVTVYAGTGMGLAICHRIALNHGGRIDLRSQSGEGARFTVWLKGEGR